MQNIRIRKVKEEAVLPTKAHPSDAGFDIYAAEDVVIVPGSTLMIDTGVAIELPEGYEAQIRPRSGVTAKTKIRVQLGTIDAGYRGEIRVITDNISEDLGDVPEDYEMFVAKGINGSSRYDLSDMATDIDYPYLPHGTYFIRKGDRIAQLVIQKLPEVMLIESDEINETMRGSGGFGSTGIS